MGGGREGSLATPISAPHDENNRDRVGFGHIYGFNLWPIDIIYGVQAIKYIGFLTMKKLFMKNINSRHYVCSHCVNISNEDLTRLRVESQPSTKHHNSRKFVGISDSNLG